MSEYGDFITGRRIELGYTLRKFCLKFSYDCGNFSKMERGILNPYSGEKLDKLIKELELDYIPAENLKELSEKELQPLQFESRKLKKDALEVAEFYGDLKIWNTPFTKVITRTSESNQINSSDLEYIIAKDNSFRKFIGGKKAREFLAKYKDEK